MDPSEAGRRSSWSKLGEPDMLVALSAVLVGVCALVVSVVQVRILREEQHTAVWPRVHVEQHYSPGRHLSFLLVNQGLGPAVIPDVRVSIDGQPTTSWAAIVETLMPGYRPRDLVRTAIGGRILSAGETITAFSTADPVLADTLVDRLRMTLCYCSVYEQCWTMTRTFEEDDPPAHERVEACLSSDAERFSN